MAKPKFEKAFADWPKTSLTNDGGVHLTGVYEHPGLANNLVSGWVLVCSLLGLATMGFGFLLIPLYLVFKPALISTYGKKLDFKIYPDRMQLRSGYRYKDFDRQLPIEFRVTQHHKAIEEELRVSRGQRAAKTYREAVEAVMQYGERRIPVAEFPLKDIEKANALVIRLQNVASSMDVAEAIVASKAKTKARDAPRKPGAFGPAPDIR